MTQPPWGAPPPPLSPQQLPASVDPLRGHGAPVTNNPWAARGWSGQQWQTPYPPQAQTPYQQPGFPTPVPQPPRKRRSGLGNAVRIVMLVVGIIMVASFINGLLDASDPTTPTTTGSGTGTGSGPTTTAPVPRAPANPNSPYQNEDYSPPPVDTNPPAVPGPRNMDAAGRLVRANPLYERTIPTPTNCQMGSVDVNTLSARDKQTHFNELMGCLMTVWDEPVQDSGFKLPRPSVTVYTRPIKTACGDFEDVNAAYCTGDQRIYYADNLLEAFPGQVGSTHYAAEMILAHEFGHTLQARTAILISEKYLEQDASSEAAALDLSRRTEVQADCLSGQFVRSVATSQGLTDPQLRNLSTLAYNLGDDVLSGRRGYSGGHGTGAARQRWFEAGLGSDAVAACNTFTVDSAQVR